MVCEEEPCLPAKQSSEMKKVFEKIVIAIKLSPANQVVKAYKGTVHAAKLAKVDGEWQPNSV